MAQYRFGRISEEFKKEVSCIIKDELKDPRVGFVSVVSAQVSGDLRHAKVFVSVLGDEVTVKESMEALKKASGFIRREIARRMNLRYTPEIEFMYDDSIVHGAKIAKLLHEVLPAGNASEDNAPADNAHADNDLASHDPEGHDNE